MLDFLVFILCLILVGLLLITAGYFICEFNPWAKKRKPDDFILGKVKSISTMLDQFEEKLGLPSNKISTDDYSLILQNFDNRLRAIYKEIKIERTPRIPQKDLPIPTIGSRLSYQPEDIWSSNERGFETIEDKAVWLDRNEASDELGIKKTTNLYRDKFPEEELVKFYNEALDNREMRNELWQKFEVLPFGNVNSTNQRLGNSLEPDFRETEDGNLYAIESSKDKYWIVPKFDFTVKVTNYENTIKHLFDCVGYDENSSYTRVKIQCPAIFIKRGNDWKLDERGALILEY